MSHSQPSRLACIPRKPAPQMALASLQIAAAAPHRWTICLRHCLQQKGTADYKLSISIPSFTLKYIWGQLPCQHAGNSGDLATEIQTIQCKADALISLQYESAGDTLNFPESLPGLPCSMMPIGRLSAASPIGMLSPGTPIVQSMSVVLMYVLRKFPCAQSHT